MGLFAGLQKDAGLHKGAGLFVGLQKDARLQKVAGLQNVAFS